MFIRMLLLLVVKLTIEFFVIMLAFSFIIYIIYGSKLNIGFVNLLYKYIFTYDCLTLYIIYVLGIIMYNISELKKYSTIYKFISRKLSYKVNIINEQVDVLVISIFDVIKINVYNYDVKILNDKYILFKSIDVNGHRILLDIDLLRDLEEYIRANNIIGYYYQLDGSNIVFKLGSGDELFSDTNEIIKFKDVVRFANEKDFE